MPGPAGASAAWSLEVQGLAARKASTGRARRTDGPDSVEALVGLLPALPVPWDIRELCDRLAVRRGRKLLLHPMNLPALPLGLWFFDGTRDHIVYRDAATGYHRDHIILHEICHMISGHNQVHDGGPGADASAALLEHTTHSPYTARQEALAESFATAVLKLASEAQTAAASAAERRASTMFGALG